MSEDIRAELVAKLEQASAALLDPKTTESKKADLSQTVLFIRHLLRKCA